MAIFSDVDFEQRYKHFLEIQKEWLTLVAGLQFYTDKNANGDDCRPIAFTKKEDVFKRAHQLVQEWQSFATLADDMRKHRDIAITTLAYSPVPTILTNPRRVIVKRYAATSTSLHSREDLIKRYDKQIAKLKKLPFAEGAIGSLEAEKKVFVQMPEATRFRARNSGYSDTIVEIIPADSTDTEVMRYGSHGMLIYGPDMNKKRDVIVSIEDKIAYNSMYNLITPVPCALFPNAELYLLDDIEWAKLISQQRVVVERAVTSRRFHFENRVASKMARLAEAGKADEVAKQIEERRQAMEELNDIDWQVFDLKKASGNTEIMTMAEMRAQYGQETESRKGQTMKHLATRHKK